MLEKWRYRGERKRGGQLVYSGSAIEVCLVVRQVYHLGFRQTEGFVQSFFQSLKVDLPVPDFTVLCRRSATVSIALQTHNGKAVRDITVDSSGLKVYGEGEWKVRKRGFSKHRTWMKLHVAVDAEDQQVQAVELTTNSVDDAQVVETLLGQMDAEIRSFTGDGAYDKIKVRELLYREAIMQLIPPQSNAVTDTKGRAYLKERNDDIKAIKRMGTKQWKVLTNYHQRSTAETFMFRYKVMLGGTLQARKISHQKTEVQVGCKILNRMLLLAKPQSEKVA